MNVPRNRIRTTVATAAALFGSGGTLVCCALPIALVSLGLGGVVAGLTSELPWLIEISRHKYWLFFGSGVLLLLSGWLVYRSGRHCPADPALARLCGRIDRWNRRILRLSGGIWLVGFFAAYLLLPLRRALGA